MVKKTVTAKELEADLKKIRRTLRKQLNSVIQTIAADLAIHTERQIVAMGAVDTGRLLRSIEVKRIKPRIYAVGTKVPYSVDVHQGLGNHYAPRPFLFYALYKNKARWGKFVADVWKKTISEL